MGAQQGASATRGPILPRLRAWNRGTGTTYRPTGIEAIQQVGFETLSLGDRSATFRTTWADGPSIPAESRYLTVCQVPALPCIRWAMFLRNKRTPCFYCFRGHDDMKWEYLVLVVKSTGEGRWTGYLLGSGEDRDVNYVGTFGLVELLNEIGADGWELISRTASNAREYVYSWEFTFKRQAA